MDTFLLKAIYRELKNIQLPLKAHQTIPVSKRTFILVLHNMYQDNIQILCSTDPACPRIHLTEQTYPKDECPFVNVLDKHIRGLWLHEFEIIQEERIMLFRFKHAAGPPNINLILELMGRNSNACIVDANTSIILGVLTHVTPMMSCNRILKPGVIFMMPPMQSRYSIGKIEEINEYSRKASLTSSWQDLLKHTCPMSPQIAKEVVYRISCGEKLETILDEIYHRYNSGPDQPIVYLESDKPAMASAFPLKFQNATKCIRFQSASKAAECVSELKEKQILLLRKKCQLNTVLKNQIAKYKRIICQLSQGVKAATNYDEDRHKGLLILQNIQSIPPFTSEIKVVDHAMKNIKICLDPRINPSDNAQKYFRKYKKNKQSLKHLKHLRDLNIKKHEILCDILNRLNSASYEEMLRYESKLVYIGVISKSKIVNSISKSSLFIINSSDDMKIYVGRNARENDRITFQIAKSKDYWLHAKNFPGAHVVVKNRTGLSEIPRTTLLQAARLAAQYSKGNYESNVDVIYTKKKFIRKTPKSPPGHVNIHKYKIVRILL